MMRVLILAATALDISAASASANGYRHHYGYGYATPVFEYEAGAYYGYPAPSYIHTPYVQQCRPYSAPSCGVSVWVRTWLLGPWLLGRVRLRVWVALASQRFATKSPSRLDSLS